MLTNQSRKIKLKPSASLLHGYQTFHDFSVVIIDFSIMQRTTTIRYFSKQDSDVQKIITSYPRLLYEFGSLKYKQLLLIDPKEGQIIVLDFDDDKLKQTIYKCQELSLHKKDINLYTFHETCTFAVSVHLTERNNKRKVMYYEYPNKYLYEQTVDIDNKKLSKANQRGELALFPLTFITDFRFSILNLHLKDFQQFYIESSKEKPTAIRSIHRLSRQKIYFLHSNTQTVSVYDTFTKQFQTIIDASNQKFSFINKHTQKYTNSTKNMIFGWIPLKQYLVLTIRYAGGSQGGPLNAYYIVNYKNGEILGLQSTDIKADYWRKSNRGIQFTEAIFQFRNAKQIEIKEWSWPRQKQLICFLADQGLGLNEEMVSAVVNAIDYDA